MNFSACMQTSSPHVTAVLPAQRTVIRPFTASPLRFSKLTGRPATRPAVRRHALGGGSESDEEESKPLTRENEPDQYWQTPSEAKGENPAKDPLALIGIAGILLPFIILGIAIGTGYVDVSNYKYGGH